MKKLILIFALLISATAFSENVKDKNEKESTTQITGKITDRLTGENLAGVKVELPGTNITTYTDFEGVFILKVPSQNLNNEINISYISYESTHMSLKNFSGDFNEIKMLPVSR